MSGEWLRRSACDPPTTPHAALRMLHQPRAVEAARQRVVEQASEGICRLSAGRQRGGTACGALGPAMPLCRRAVVLSQACCHLPPHCAASRWTPRTGRIYSRLPRKSWRGASQARPRAFSARASADGAGAADRWQQYTDPASGNPYYFNVATQVTQWERPAELGEPSADERPKRFTEQTVPSSPMQRVVGFAGLGINLAAGVGMEVARHAAGGSSDGGSALLSTRNSEVLAAELCRMRGAALKLGQMLSLQDESFLPAPLAEALKRVRTHADVMPAAQLEQVMSQNLGTEWRSKFAHFGMLPVAAASIGQVHQAALHDGRAVAVKIQYLLRTIDVAYIT